MKLLRAFSAEGERLGYMFWCPGCDEAHPFYVAGPNAKWTFNGDEERPTFAPSLLLQRSKNDGTGRGPRCHLFLTDGVLQYLGDCEHALANQSVPLQEWPL
ncbi:MAG: DUF6527 family protein [Myxococcaceae bacterium]|nr:DUF6527 family protein [Myxococcaceae bacterium]